MSYEACMRAMFEDFSQQLYDKVCASVQELCYGCQVGKLLLWYYTIMLYIVYISIVFLIYNFNLLLNLRNFEICILFNVIIL